MSCKILTRDGRVGHTRCDSVMITGQMRDGVLVRCAKVFWSSGPYLMLDGVLACGTLEQLFILLRYQDALPRSRALPLISLVTCTGRCPATVTSTGQCHSSRSRATVTRRSRALLKATHLLLLLGHVVTSTSLWSSAHTLLSATLLLQCLSA